MTLFESAFHNVLGELLIEVIFVLLLLALTIGFERDRAYLANALEIFLISKLQPVHNVVKVGM
ncbi:TPA: hypothetical protein ACJK7M_003546 [Acinetobacter baumannii]